MTGRGEAILSPKTWTFKAKEFVVSKSRLKDLIKSASDLNNGLNTALGNIPVLFSSTRDASLETAGQCLRQILILGKDLRGKVSLHPLGWLMKNSSVLGVRCCMPRKKGEHGHGTWTYLHISPWQQFCCLESLEPFTYPPSSHWGSPAAKHSLSSHPLLTILPLAEAGWKVQ